MQDPLAVGDEGLGGAVLASVDVLLHRVQVHRTGHKLAVVGELLLVHRCDERLRLWTAGFGNRSMAAPNSPHWPFGKLPTSVPKLQSCLGVKWKIRAPKRQCEWKIRSKIVNMKLIR